ncbi:tRNA(Ile)(2)-agmatinylcytidine synthase [Salinarchaeum sp. Harcht-Bsk1]|uniref:tRNA(Ile)(2)-agmatinylcytidine synthase n=1 Tax=Salinarchaeum sp. Harcht-Bsk1 TaxID=1333523 RepID=UPI0006777368|nr:tRNA(Ile)(2)-agmatinylcytidine synthase [Salinarchaeum sp. Harcht-Bsk1]
MPVVGLDDTDSRERGMCTTYVAVRIGERLAAAGFDVQRHLLVRCNPAVEHKTRGNAALALHVRGAEETPDSAARQRCFDVARETISELAATADTDANPGLIVADTSPEAVPDEVAAFAETAVQGHHAIEDAVALADRFEYRHAGWGDGRGRIGALAAVGAWRANEDWTYERIAYRESARWGSEREVDRESVFEAAASGRTDVWDTVDRGTNTAVCVPRTPCPVLFGIRGDDPAAVEAVAKSIDSEPIDRAVTFVTNQGTDAHLQNDPDGTLEDDRAYRVPATVTSSPETREGGHVFVSVRTSRNGSPTPDEGIELPCVAFEPTKRFREHVRNLRPGDELTVCGEVSDGTLKLEKFAVRDLVETETATPVCPDCERTMESAGANQGYRCRDCGTDAPGPVERPIDRDLDLGWYEVPPVARRHVAKPLIRGGFDAPTHPEH